MIYMEREKKKAVVLRKKIYEKVFPIIRKEALYIKTSFK